MRAVYDVPIEIMLNQMAVTLGRHSPGDSRSVLLKEIGGLEP
ncbi:hypothetical protein Mth01_53540 [Sphaerimonospora thailandensis]|uniref:Uncharacterized protein n=1 Tax=Sphaerimonospora thailandensis TaxID=795644 RepID=A0A8J3RF32_9ACTN|nr:hypothetical protein Mth01_53540 [Sphaerimonospora thailandensis]